MRCSSVSLEDAAPLPDVAAVAAPMIRSRNLLLGAGRRATGTRRRSRGRPESCTRASQRPFDMAEQIVLGAGIGVDVAQVNTGAMASIVTPTSFQKALRVSCSPTRHQGLSEIKHIGLMVAVRLLCKVNVRLLPGGIGQAGNGDPAAPGNDGGAGATGSTGSAGNPGRLWPPGTLSPMPDDEPTPDREDDDGPVFTGFGIGSAVLGCPRGRGRRAGRPDLDPAPQRRRRTSLPHPRHAGGPLTGPAC